MLKFIFYKFSNWGKIRCYGSCKLDITYWTDSLIFRRKKVAVFNDNAEKKVIIMQKIFVNVNLVVFCSVLFCSVLFCSVLFLFRFVSSTLPVRRWTTRQKKKKLIRSRWRRRWRRKKMMMTKKKQTNVKMFWKKFSKFFPALLSQSFSTSYWKSGFFFFCFFSPLNFLSLSITYVFAWNNKKKENQEMNYMLSAKLYNWFFADHISLLFLHRLSANRCFSASSVSSLNLFFLFMFFCKY